MLVLTEAAAQVVKSVTSNSQVPVGAGLRIATAPDPQGPDALQLTATTGPRENDEVVETDGARVFLEPQVALFLEDKILDAEVDEQGNAYFALGVQGS
jgi:iron-sulfur cluster assembly protein